MNTTFQKRQKEMKRIEKRKMKEEKRAQRKLIRPTLRESNMIRVRSKPSDWNHSNEINFTR